MQHAIVLHRESGQVRVGDQIPPGVSTPEHLLEMDPMLVAGLDHAPTGLVEPTLHAGDRLLQQEGTLVQPGVGADADEGVLPRPAQNHRLHAAELPVPSGARRLVMLGQAVLA